nr:DUF3095 family protein [Rhizobium grahamii]
MRLSVGFGPSGRNCRASHRSPCRTPRAPGRHDLNGLSCRWSPIVSRHGAIVSIIAVPSERVSTPEF